MRGTRRGKSLCRPVVPNKPEAAPQGRRAGARIHKNKAAMGRTLPKVIMAGLFIGVKVPWCGLLWHGHIGCCGRFQRQAAGGAGMTRQRCRIAQGRWTASSVPTCRHRHAIAARVGDEASCGNLPGRAQAYSPPARPVRRACLTFPTHRGLPAGIGGPSRCGMLFSFAAWAAHDGRHARYAARCGIGQLPAAPGRMTGRGGPACARLDGARTPTRHKKTRREW